MFDGVNGHYSMVNDYWPMAKWSMVSGWLSMVKGQRIFNSDRCLMVDGLWPMVPMVNTQWSTNHQ